MIAVQKCALISVRVEIVPLQFEVPGLMRSLVPSVIADMAASSV